MRNPLFYKKCKSNAGKIYRAKRTLILAILCFFSFATITALSIDHTKAAGIKADIAMTAISLGAGMPVLSTAAQINETANTQNNAPPALNSKPAGNIIFPQMNLSFRNVSELISANNVPDVSSFTWQVTSTNGVGAVPTRIYMLQQSEMQNITDNGSGGGSIAYLWQDGNNGKTISRLMAYGRAGVGRVCHGGSIRVDVTNGGTTSGYAPGVAALNAYFATINEIGVPQALVLNSNADQTRKDQDTSIFVFSCIQNLSPTTQLSCVIPGDNAGNIYTLTCTLYIGEENFAR